jgi:DNA ligase D-like protein (predicted ligase)
VKWQDLLSEEEQEKRTETAQPDWVQPMLATLTDDYFDDPEWIYERKLDGQRCLVFRNDGRVEMFSRNKKPQNQKFPELIEALSGQGADLIADGEIVTFKDGVSSFSKLQPRIHSKQPKPEIPVFLYLFDLLHFAGSDLTSLPLRGRKRLLKQLIEFRSPVRYTPHRNESGTEFLKEACGKGWEGLIAKDATSTYVHSRSKKWLKFKCENGQEFVLGGYTSPQGERTGFGALLLGYYKNNKLRYAGKVGTGFDDKLLRGLTKQLEQLHTESSPFHDFSPESEEYHWVKPKLVGEVRFTEWTAGGKLRHPSFQGLRSDKEPGEVVREK